MYFFFRHAAYLLDYNSVNITVYTGRPKHSFDSLDWIICSTVVVWSTTHSISKACLNESAEESMGMSGGYWHYSCFFLILQNTFGLWQWCAQHDESNHNILWCPPQEKRSPVLTLPVTVCRQLCIIPSPSLLITLLAGVQSKVLQIAYWKKT